MFYSHLTILFEKCPTFHLPKLLHFCLLGIDICFVGRSILHLFEKSSKLHSSMLGSYCTKSPLVGKLNFFEIVIKLVEFPSICNSIKIPTTTKNTFWNEIPGKGMSRIDVPCESRTTIIGEDFHRFHTLPMK